MAQEEVRGCGFRKVGATYLCGEYIAVPCDRLPYPLDTCPACGGGVKVSRGFTRIIPLHMFGFHQPCNDRVRPCFVCDPTTVPAFIMRVGEAHYKTPGDFSREARRMGVSKRIPFIPKEMEFGATIVYLAHAKACRVVEIPAVQQAMALIRPPDDGSMALLETEKVEWKLGIFSAFKPQRVERLIWEKDASPEELEKLHKRGITPVIIKNGDTDHA